MRTNNPYDQLRSIMRENGATCNPKEFYWAVNEAYHAAEAELYDDIHIDMFKGLEVVWARLFSYFPAMPEKLSLLDIGAGTGLVGEFVNRFCPQRVSEMVILDPSAEMIEKCKLRSQKWSFPCTFIKGDLSSIDAKSKYHSITLNSVLHHIVEVKEFCKYVQTFLHKGGVLLISHDPRGEAEGDKILFRRKQKARKRWIRRMRWRGLFPRIIEKVKVYSSVIIRKRYIEPLAMATNKHLLHKNIITHPMDLSTIHEITDFHVPGKHKIGRGIKLGDLEKWLDKLNLLDSFTYQYCGLEWTNLTRKEKEVEKLLWQSNDEHGSLFGSAWRLEEIENAG